MTFTRRDAAKLAREWKEQGYSKAEARAGLKARIKNVKSGNSFADAAYGLLSAPAQTAAGIWNQAKRITPKSWHNKAIFTKPQEWSKRVEMGNDIRGMDAKIARFAGDIGTDALIIGGLTAAAFPSGGSSMLAAAPRLAKYGKYLKPVVKFAKKHKVLTAGAKMFGQNMLDAPIEYARAKSRQEDYNWKTTIGASMLLAGIGGKLNVNAARKMVGRTADSMSRGVKNIIDEDILTGGGRGGEIYQKIRDLSYKIKKKGGYKIGAAQSDHDSYRRLTREFRGVLDDTEYSASSRLNLSKQYAEIKQLNLDYAVSKKELETAYAASRRVIPADFQARLNELQEKANKKIAQGMPRKQAQRDVSKAWGDFFRKNVSPSDETHPLNYYNAVKKRVSDTEQKIRGTYAEIDRLKKQAEEGYQSAVKKAQAGYMDAADTESMSRKELEALLVERAKDEDELKKLLVKFEALPIREQQAARVLVNMNVAQKKALYEKHLSKKRRSPIRVFKDYWRIESRDLKKTKAGRDALVRDDGRFRYAARLGTNLDSAVSKVMMDDRGDFLLSDKQLNKVAEFLTNRTDEVLTAEESKAAVGLRKWFNGMRESAPKDSGYQVVLNYKKNYLPQYVLPKVRTRLKKGRISKQMVDEMVEHAKKRNISEIIDGNPDEIGGRAYLYLKRYGDSLKQEKDIAGGIVGATKSRMEQGRAYDFPTSFLEMDLKKLIPAAIDDYSQRMASAKYYGANHQFLAQDLANIAKEGKLDATQFARSLKQIIVRSPEQPWISNLKSIATLKMMFSAASNIGDLMPTSIAFGTARTLKETAHLVVSKKRRALARTFAGAMDDLSKGKAGLSGNHKWTASFLRAVGFSYTQEITDASVAMTGISYVESLLKGLKKNPGNLILRQRIQNIVGTDVSERIMKEGLTDALKREVGIGAMLKLRPIRHFDVPFAYNAGGAYGAPTQFKRFAASLSNVIHDDIVGAWKGGDKKKALMGLNGLIVGGMLTGEAVSRTRDGMWDLLFGSYTMATEGEWSTRKKKEETTEDIFARVLKDPKATKDLISRLIERIGDAGGLGLVTEFYETLQSEKYGKASLWGSVAGPAAQVLIDLGLAGAEIKKDSSLEAIGGVDEGATKDAIIKGILSPVPHIQKAYKHGVARSKQAPDIVWSTKTPLERAAEAEEQGFGEESGFISQALEKIKEIIPGATDAGAAATMVGSARTAATQDSLKLAGERAKNLAEVIKKGNGKWFKVAKVEDGDTIYFEDGSRLRMLGVNAPEIAKAWKKWWDPGRYNQPGAQAAKKFTSDAFPVGSKAYVDYDESAGKKDPFGRKLGYVYTEDGRDISKEMIEKGHSKVYKKYAFGRRKEFEKIGKPSSLKEKVRREARVGRLALPDANKHRKQCGAYVNDMLKLTGPDRMGNWLSTKTDSPNFVKGGRPKKGAAFVEDIGKHGHTGIVTKVIPEGYFITDYNFKNDEKKMTAFIKFGSTRDKRMVGYLFPKN